MYKKMKLTKDQEKALKSLLEYFDFQVDQLINSHAVNGKDEKWELEYKPLNKLSVAEVARALYGGYEVINELREGDILYHPKVGRLGTVKGVNVCWDDDVENSVEYSFLLLEDAEIRFATPNDIERGKERGFWAKHKREPWELKQGDVLMGTQRQLYEVTGTPISNGSFYYTGNDNYDFDIKECRDKNWEVVCFEEDRLD